MITDAIRTWLITAPGWELVTILAFAALGVLCLIASAAMVVFVLRVTHADERVQEQAASAEEKAMEAARLAMYTPEDAPQEIDGSDCHD